jgi:hypothetical protein
MVKASVVATTSRAAMIVASRAMGVPLSVEMSSAL